ncbi:hypothetical protein AB7008_26390 [Bradyrhizobium sp. 521_C7_N1_3]|uniref:hypothetical protein n=1 Tax=Bradyrhizobium TaxID=374 RepID=UPI0027149F5A|nr:hypothetical protein [Bradyrhizobium japonicum]WLB58575.1 hypothetical protein QIH94_22160 [Bradyrhizobium japonicum]WLB59624.1 hypothetical protein QIH96_24170 [Bradyrhizobium japonicum]
MTMSITPSVMTCRFPSGCLHGGDEAGVEPGIDRRAILDRIIGKDILGDLGHEGAGGGVRGCGRQQGRKLEELGSLGDDLRIASEFQAVMALNAHEHLRLEINNERCVLG